MIIMNRKIELIKKLYPAGTIVELIEMDDLQAPPSGTVGEVKFVDDMGNIHVSWENGSSLALVPEADEFKIRR